MTVAEFGALAVVLRLFLAVGLSELEAAAIALTPSFLVLTGPWTLFANRWTWGLRPDAPVERVREEVVQLPRRILFLRSIATVGVALVMARTSADAAHLASSAAAVIAGSAVAIAFGFNNLRALLYRRLLDELAEKVYANDFRLYLARTLRERMFVAANVLGIGGTLAAMLYAYFVVGASMTEYIELLVLLPMLISVLAAGFGLDLFAASRPVVAWSANQPGATARDSFAASNVLPYRLAASNLLAWMIAAALVAIGHWRHGALPAEVAQVFAGIVAVGCGVVLYQAVWHRRTLDPLHEEAAAELQGQGKRAPRSRISLAVKLAVVFLLLLGFGGTFSLATTYAEHERLVSSIAAQRAGEELDWLQSHTSADKLVEEGGPHLRHDSPAVLFLVHPDRVWSAREVHLPDVFYERIREADSGTAPVPGVHASATWRRISPTVQLGVFFPWRESDTGPWGRAPLAFVFVSLLVAAVGAMLLFSQELAAPIRELERAARRLGRGDLDTPISITEADEVGSLATALETSRQKLKQTLQEVRELNAALEERVRERTAELEQRNSELADALARLAEVQDQVVQAEKLASLGRLSAGIAHEVNNPLNFVKNTLPPLKSALAQLSTALKQTQFDPLASDAELARQARAFHAEREKQNLDGTLEEIDDVVRVMSNGVDRMGTILRALLDFSRQTPEGKPERFSLDEAVRGALALLRHDLRDRIDVKVELNGVQMLIGQPGPLGQVLVNLVKNGAEAIEGPGTIEIRARHDGDKVELSVHDSGKGMAPEAVQHAFEPFFTTKPVGKGTGLGLAMVHGIVQKHGGSVRLTSTPGQGTTVILCLPQPNEAKVAELEAHPAHH